MNTPAILTPLLLFFLVNVIDDSTRNAQLRDVRRDLIAAFSQRINERLTRASLLRSALARYPAVTDSDVTTQVPPDLAASKQRYEDAVSNWNASRHVNLRLLRQIFGDDDDYGHVAELIEARLVTSAFAPLNTCLNTAYENAIGDKVEHVHVKELLSSADDHRKAARECGFQIVEGLYLLTDSASINSASTREGHLKDVVKLIEASCPLTQRTPALCIPEKTSTLQ